MPKTMPQQKPHRSKQDYRTPKVFLRAVKQLLGIEAFAVDLAASKDNTVAKRFFSERTNALSPRHSWVFDGWNWMNPPFSDIEPWVRKAYEQGQLGAQTAMLIPAAVGSNWWRDHVHGKARVLLLNGRITFVGHKQPYPKDCALLLYSQNIAATYEIWSWMKPDAVPEAVRFENHAGPKWRFRVDLAEADVRRLADGVVPEWFQRNAEWWCRDNPKPSDVPPDYKTPGGEIAAEAERKSA